MKEDRGFVRWAWFALAATLGCGLVYLIVQQGWRRSADHPQVELVADAIARLAAGEHPASVVPADVIDLADSTDAFVIIFGETGGIVASSARLHGQVRGVPPGVLDRVRDAGVSHVTWQPERGVRMATVIAPVTSAPRGFVGFVLAGRSLRATERRIALSRSAIGAGWIVALAGLFALVATGGRSR